MTIEEEIFARHRVLEDRLEPYGFTKENGNLVYEIVLPKEDFKIIITYDGAFSGHIIDQAIGEEYTNFRIKNATGFSAESVEVINVKVDSSKIGEILSTKGYYPAFHMNKKCWVSIILDETLPDTEIQRRIADSYTAI